MFCSQCGNRVPDGSRFCGLCGTKISVDLEIPASQRAQQYIGNYAPEASFDWSGVKEEPHKKYAKDVVSPWGTTGMIEEPAPVKDESNDTSQQRSRTMSFIDILKKEREEKALEEELEIARAEEERKAQVQKPSVYIPPVYEDVNSPVITPFDAPMYTITEEQHYSAPMDTRPEMTIPPASIDRLRNTQSVEYTNIVDERYQQSQQPSIDPAADYAEANRARLTAELSAILDANATPAKQVNQAAPSFTNNYAENRDLTDMYLSMDSENTARVATSRLHVPPMYDESQYAPAHEQPVAHPAQAPAYEQQIPQTPMQAPAYERPAQAPVSSTTSEIELLKARLAELMGVTMTGQIEMPEPEIDDSIIEPRVVETVPEQAGPAVIPAEPVHEAHVQEPTPAPQVVEEPVPAPEPEPVPQVAEEPIAAPEPAPIPEPTSAPEPEPEPVPQVVEEPEPAPEPETVAEPEPVPEPTFAQELAEELAFLDTATEAEEELPLIDPTPEVEEELPLINEEIEKAIAEAEVTEEDATTDAMSVQELEKDLFGETTEEDIQAEETKKIDKFYTLYKKNEEFQRLLDEEYNKLKSESEEVPTVSAVLGEDSDKKEGKKAEESKENAAKTENATSSNTVVPTVSEEEEDEPSKGGTALTVIAVIIAILLVVLLAVILVLNFAPDSAIALQIDSIIETITSYFSGVEAPGRLLL